MNILPATLTGWHLLIATGIPTIIFLIFVILFNEMLPALLSTGILPWIFYLIGWCPLIIAGLCGGLSDLYLIIFYLIPWLQEDVNKEK